MIRSILYQAPIVTVIVALLIAATPCHAGQHDGARKVLTALSAGLVDSAFIYLGDAVQAGLPDDSLYYLWAEMYRARGSLDTALALSIAGQRADKGTLTNPLRIQRYNIYLALGLKKDADDLLDTILGSSAPPVRRAIPRISIISWLGGHRRGMLERQPYPFTVEPPVDTAQWNPGWDFSPTLNWFLPLKNGMTLVPGIGYGFSNGVERSEFIWDTLNHALSVSLDLKNIWRRFSLGYQLQRRINMYGDKSWVNTANLTRSTVGSSRLSYSSLLYSIENADDDGIAYQALWLMHYQTTKLTPNISLNIAPLATCFLTDDIVTTWQSRVMYIEDPTADTIRHYTDASCTRLIPIPPGWIEQIFLPSLYFAASDTKTSTMTAPESYVGLTPAAGLEFALPAGFSLEVTLKGMVNYYFKEHTWTSYAVPYDPERRDGGAWLAYSRSDGRYYVLDELGNITLERYDGPFEIRQHTKRRIDFMLGGEVLLERSMGKFGTIGINGYFKKYHSTLQNDLPVRMKNLFYGAGISCRVFFGAAQPLSAL